MLTVPGALQQKTSCEFEEIVLPKLTGIRNLCFDNHKAHISFDKAMQLWQNAWHSCWGKTTALGLQPLQAKTNRVAKTQVVFFKITDIAGLSVNGHSQTTMMATSGKKGKVKCMTFPFEVQSSIDDGQPRTESRKRQLRKKKRKMNHTMSSLCHPAYCERHESEQWCLSRGALYAHLHWFGSSIHETGTLFIHTYSAKLVAVHL